LYPVHRDRAKDGGSKAITHRYEILESCARIPADNRPSGGGHHGFHQQRLSYRPPISTMLACDWTAESAADGEVESASAAFTLV
jgi:hypothetical protein